MTAKRRPHFPTAATQARDITPADLPGKRDEVGELNTSEVSMAEAQKLSALDTEGQLINERLLRTQKGENVKCGVQRGPAGWDALVRWCKAKGAWDSGRVDVRALEPEEHFPPIRDMSSVATGETMYARLVQMCGRDTRVTVECRFYGTTSVRALGVFILPAQPGRVPVPAAAPAVQQVGVAGVWPPNTYPGIPAGAPPPAPLGQVGVPGYTYPAAPTTTAQAPPVPPALPTPTQVQQGLSGQDAQALVASVQRSQMEMLQWAQQQQELARAANPQPVATPAPTPRETNFADQLTAILPVLKQLVAVATPGSTAPATQPPAPPKSALDSLKELMSVMAVAKSLTSELNGTPAEPASDGPIHMVDGPGGVKVAFDKDGNIDKTTSMIMGAGTLLEEVKSSVASVMLLRKEQMEREEAREKAERETVSNQLAALNNLPQITQCETVAATSEPTTPDVPPEPQDPDALVEEFA